MNFRDIDKGATLLGRRWLREMVFEDWGIKLLALLITVSLWYAVAGQRAPATARLRNVPLVINPPGDMEISNEPVEQIDVTLRGSRRALDAIKSNDLIINFDASSYRPGERLLRLTPQNVKLELPDEVSPQDVTIERIEPASVPLRLERRVERELAVQPQFEGQLPAGYIVAGVEISPTKIRVRGPESYVNALSHARTETIALDAKTESFTVPHAAIDIPDQKVNPLEAVVDLFVKIEEEKIERTMAGVPVRLADENGGATARPASASVELRGPRSAVESLRPEDISLVLDKAEDGALNPRLSLPATLQVRIELLSTTPTKFSIK